MDRSSMSAANRTPDQIYFVVADSVAMVKIGVSSGIRRRLSAMQGGSPVALRLACVSPGCKLIEAQVHAAFAPEWRHSEWFELSDRLAKAIQRIADGEALASVVDLPPLIGRPRPYGRDRFSRRMAEYQPSQAAA